MSRRQPPFEIPTEITIRGKRWLVARDVDLRDSQSKHDARSRIALARSGPTRGITYPENHPHICREIHLSTHLSPWSTCTTFVHELLHACSEEKIPIVQEEKFVTDVEVPLTVALSQLTWRR